ncbi:MAG: hypothetical protein J1F10_04625 [Muribaculaceae bacterium]|nr:hypothetical protein [Muribaculaceae bacterium]
MKKIVSKFFKYSVALGCIALVACAPESIDGLDANMRPKADEIDAVITVDQETNQVKFVLNNQGVTPIWKIYISDKPRIVTLNNYNDIVVNAGTYQVEVQMYNRNGVCDGSKTYEFTLENTIVDFTPFMRRLTNGESKTWMFASEKAAHLGCGPAGTIGTEWYSAAPGDKAGTGLYENRFIFTDNGGVSTGGYTYDPAASGTVYVNCGIESLPPFTDNRDASVDYAAPAQLQETTFEIKPEGNDLFLTMPSGTLLGYIPFASAYTNPKYRILNITNNELELCVEDPGVIAWHYILTIEGDAPFAGFKYDSEFNIWRKAELTVGEFYYAPNWSPIAAPEYTFDGTTYKLTLPAATSDQWQCQMPILSNISTSADINYDFSCIITSSIDHPGITVKLVMDGDDGVFYFADRVAVKAGEEYVYYQSDMPGIDIETLKLVLDFGGNAENTVVTVGNIVLKNHADDDGTKLPEPPVVPSVIWDLDGPGNFWNAATFTNEFYYAPGWNQIDNPGFDIDGKSYKVTLPAATYEQWQAQVKFFTDITTSADKKYDFRITFNSNTDHSGVTVKFVMHGDDGVFYMADRVKVTAYDDCTFEWVGLDGIDMSNLDLVLDFGGNADNTVVTVSQIIVQEHNPIKE